MTDDIRCSDTLYVTCHTIYVIRHKMISMLWITQLLNFNQI